MLGLTGALVRTLALLFATRSLPGGGRPGLMCGALQEEDPESGVPS